MIKRLVDRLRRPALLQFLETDAAGGFILAGCAVVALFLANSDLAGVYKDILHTHLPVSLGPVAIDLDVEEWIKDGLMTLFFFVVGLELKRELVVGELSDPRIVVLPVAAALGGMIAPVAVYLAINAGGDPRGWPVPVATDIAFAVAALAIVARSMPVSLRIFLLTLAVVDDLGAVVLIALLFSGDLDLPLLGGVAVVLAGMVLIAVFWRRAPIWVYGVGVLLVWLLALKSGIHTSVAGVAAAFTVPLRGQGSDGAPGPVERLETALHPISAYVVLPLFAIASAGIPLGDLTFEDVMSPVPFGIALGLAAGKPIGVLLASYAVILPGLAKLPSGARHMHMVGVACLCGIGFTMSLFLGALAFAGDYTAEIEARLGVLSGSVLALILGAAAFALAKRSQPS